MPTGYRVTLTNGSLTPGDVLSTGAVFFVSTGSQPGSIYATGGSLTDALVSGRFHLASDGQVYFVPDSSITLTSARVADPPAYSTESGVITGTGNYDVIDGSYTDEDGDSVGDGDDIVFGGGDFDDIYGLGGNDTLYGGAGADWFFGGAGDDTFHGGRGSDLFDGGDGTDIISYENSNAAVQVNLATNSFAGGEATGDEAQSNVEGLIGSAYGDTLTGTDSTTAGNVIDGRGGDDVIDGGDGPDQLYGGAGNDVIRQGAGDALLEGGTGNDTLFAGEGSDTLRGGDGADQIDAGRGNDTVEGGAGDDTIRAGDGDDLVSGGAGNDLIYGDDSADAAPAPEETFSWTVNGAGDLTGGLVQTTGLMTVSASITNNGNLDAATADNGTQMFVGSEGFATQSSLSLTGTTQGTTATVGLDFAAVDPATAQETVRDVVFRINDVDNGGWQDRLAIRAFDAAGQPVEVIVSSTGTHTLTSGLEAEIISTQANGSAQSESGSVLVRIAGPVSRVEVDYDNLNTAGQYVALTDVKFTPLLPATASNDTLSGGAGDDTIWGQTGDDILDGGTGNDSLSGGTGADQIDGGDGADTLDGGDGADTLSGGAGVDQIDGGAGNDQIAFGTGDTASGGDGDDVFMLTDFADTTTGTITIVGGEGGETTGDVLNLNGLASAGKVTYSNTDDAAGGLSGTVTLFDGSVLNFSEIEQVICFTPGTVIATPQGERPVETLRQGDSVLARDGGLRRIRWRGDSRVSGQGSAAPIRLRAGALPGQRADLVVSPQHRMLLSGARLRQVTGLSEAFAPARHLLDGGRVVAEPCAQVTYIHLLLDVHDVVTANGAACESFLPGPMGLGALSDLSREQLFRALPSLRADPGSYGPPARPVLRAAESRAVWRPQQDTTPALARICG